MTPYKVKFRLRISVLRYFRDNLGAPFIIVFMILLIACAVLLAVKSERLAEELAVYAYYLLVIGVVLQLASFIMEERGKAGVKEGREASNVTDGDLAFSRMPS
ncbi:MAG: hypothetical protein QXT26_03685 [Thermoproteota archaeon]